MCMCRFRNRLLDITCLRYTRYMKYRNNPTWVRRVVFFYVKKSIPYERYAFFVLAIISNMVVMRHCAKFAITSNSPSGYMESQSPAPVTLFFTANPLIL